MDLSISQTLQGFNRKERYWVFRNAFEEETKRLPDAFCRRVEEALTERGVHIDRATVWWAVDYHIDWLHAALHLPKRGPSGKFEALRNGGPGIEDSKPILGQQEDIDLIIASGSDVVLIEAKAFSGWSGSQLSSKLDRLALLGAKPDGAIDGAGVRIHFILRSMERPKKLLGKEMRWPEWALDSRDEPFWLQLRIERPIPDLRVTRCDTNGKADADGSSWTVK